MTVRKSRAILMGPLATPKREYWKKIVKRLEIRKTDLLCGVDGGARAWVQFGKHPDLAVGDWDSLNADPSVLQKIRRIDLPVDKDASDLAHALDQVRDEGAKHVVCVGVTGGRADHHLGAMFELSRFSAEKGLPLRSVTAVGPEGHYHFLSAQIPAWHGKLKKGALLSVFASGGIAQGVTIRGMKFPLENERLRPSSRGLSNVARGGPCEIRVRKGQLIVVIPSDPSEFRRA